MKRKDAFLGLCIVALVAAMIILYLRAMGQRDAALAQARTAQHDAQQARADLEQIKTDTAGETSENSRLRSENQRLTRQISQMRDQYTQLSQTNLWLAQQIASLSDVAQQQQDQLQQIQVENQQAQQAQIEADRVTCISNLREISVAKTAWALENDEPATAVPTEQDLLPYLPGGVFPVCPSGGIYSINAVGVPPTCSIPGHVLPQQ